MAVGAPLAPVVAKLAVAPQGTLAWAYLPIEGDLDRRAIESVNAFTRKMIQEQGMLRRILPPVEIDDAC